MPIRFTLENYENELTEARSILLGVEQGFNTKEGKPEKHTNQTKSQKNQPMEEGTTPTNPQWSR